MLRPLQPSDIKLIKVFVAVAESRGLSAAQVKLHRSLTAISSDLQDLETRLGSKLCMRGRSGFALTEFGRQVYDASHQLFDALERFQVEIMTSRDYLRGELRIAVQEGQINDPGFMLSEAIRRFRDRPKNLVKVGIAISSHEQILQGILNNEVDVGFGFFNVDHPRIERIPLYQEPNLLFCGRNHPLFGMSANQMTVKRVLGYPMILRTPRPANFYPACLAGVTAAAIGKEPESRAYMILSGHYLGWLARRHAERWMKEGAMRPIMPQVLHFSVTMEAAVKRVALKPPHVALFLTDYLTASSGHLYLRG
jgi:DNA-binding transcriptional LysR family regulator